MARTIRLDLPNSFYHVLARGNERRKIFYDTRDYKKFLEILGKTTERFKIEIHAYVLMPNHYHLLLHTKNANLSKAIQWLSVSYTVWFNKKHNRIGHLFQGRFKSFIIENDKYFATLCLYTHGNPLRAGIVKDLSDYTWSSYPGYLNSDKRGEWLTTNMLLSMYGDSARRLKRAHVSYLGQKTKIFDDLHKGICLGTKEFAKTCMKGLKDLKSSGTSQIKSLLKTRNIYEIAREILLALGEGDPNAVFVSKKKKRKINRDITIFILSNLGIFTNKEIGELFGVGYTAVSEAAKRGAELSQSNIEIRKKVNNITIDI